MIAFIFKFPFQILFVLFFFLYELFTRRLFRLYESVDGNQQEVFKIYSERMRKGLDRLDSMIPYFWAAIMMAVSYFIFKNNIS